MNGQEQEVDATYTIEEGVVKIRASIDVLNWGAQEAVEALNAVCKERHTGTDGKSVTWPDANILIKTMLTKKCPETV